MAPWQSGEKGETMKDLDVLQRMQEDKLCGIIRKVSLAEAKGIVGALLEGRVSLVEVAFNTPDAAAIIQAVKQKFGDRVIVGAGTVLDAETARTAILAGADFILSPTLHIEVIRICQKYNVLAVPGVFTPTEMIQAWEAGARMVKLFPAVAATPTFIKQVMGPLDQLAIMAVGGITDQNAAAFIQAGACCVGVGSEIAGKQLIQGKDYSEITIRAQQYVTALSE